MPRPGQQVVVTNPASWAIGQRGRVVESWVNLSGHAVVTVQLPSTDWTFAAGNVRVVE